MADTVAAPIEQQVNGVENMMYMSSQCTNDGAYTLTVTFKHGIDLNMAQVLVQNRVSLAATGHCPRWFSAAAITVKKKSPSVLMIINLVSKTDDNTCGATCTCPTTPRFSCGTSCRGCRASATSPTSASATTACAFGQTRKKWPC